VLWSGKGIGQLSGCGAMKKGDPAFGQMWFERVVSKKTKEICSGRGEEKLEDRVSLIKGDKKKAGQGPMPLRENYYSESAQKKKGLDRKSRAWSRFSFVFGTRCSQFFSVGGKRVDVKKIQTQKPS